MRGYSWLYTHSAEGWQVVERRHCSMASRLGLYRVVFMGCAPFLLLTIIVCISIVAHPFGFVKRFFAFFKKIFQPLVSSPAGVENM